MSLKIFRYLFFVISVIGLFLLLWANLSVVFGMPAPVEPSFIQVFLVIFPTWFFTIYYSNQTRPLLDESVSKGMTSNQKFQYYLGYPPPWAMKLVAVLLVYALFNFVFFLSGGIMDPEFVNGHYQFNNHGKVTIYTKAEYVALHNLHIRSVTGFFLAFFSISAMILTPWPKRDGDPKPKQKEAGTPGSGLS